MICQAAAGSDEYSGHRSSLENIQCAATTDTVPRMRGSTDIPERVIAWLPAMFETASVSQYHGDNDGHGDHIALLPG